jgi:predicted phosphodiesterase
MLAGKSILWFFLMSCTLVLSVLFTSMQVNSAFADFNFGAAGDWGCNSNTQKTVSNIRSHNSPEKVLALGDYSYQSTATCWLNIIDAIKSRTRINIGNHEDDSNEGFSQYMSAFNLPTTYQAFTYGNVRVIIMDTDHFSYSVGSNQYNFVISQLQQASQNSAIKWIIISLHKQMYTSPNTCGASSCSNTASDATNLRNIYHGKFDQYGVDVVLNGHLHNYQRTFPIKYDSGSPSSPTRTSTATTEYNDPTGEIFVTVGTGGVNIHALSGKSYFVQYQQDDRFGALDLNVENNGYTLAGRYYTNDGVKRDVFKITKTGTAQYTFGPSLSLSGETASSTLTGEDASIGVSGGNVPDKTVPDNGNQGQNNGQGQNNVQGQNNGQGQNNVQGKGQDCEHFTQQGPLQCREP